MFKASLENKMIRALQRLVPLLGSLALVACGGGGSDSGGAIQPPQTVSVAVSSSQSTLGVNSLSDIAFNVTRRGTGVPDGTVVSLSVDNPALGQVGAASGDNQAFNNSAQAATAGGVARFRFKSTRQTGTVVVRASVNDPQTPSVNITGQTSISLNGGPTKHNRLTMVADRTQIPINLEGVPPSCRGYPYQAEVVVTWRNLRGELVTLPVDDDAMRASWTSAANVGALGIPDDPETTDINECELFLASTGLALNAGRATVFARSLGFQGTGTLTVGVRDLDTGEDLSAEMEFTMISGVPNMPASLDIVPQGSASYVQTDRAVRVFVNDGAGSPVPNPEQGGVAWNNVRLEILNPQGERLRTTSASGATQEGTVVNTRTANGIASAIFISSTREGPVTLRATADRADNNIDNGIQNAVTAENTIVVSDGQLFSLTITSPFIDSLFVNESDFGGAPDGSYSVIMSAVATDRLGNPVRPGTVIDFGLIDAPIQGAPDGGSGPFAISGGNGDPQEGGTLFTAANGAFTTAGGGAGPGDALVLFGRSVAGNRDLEMARVIQSVTGPGSLTVTRRFNLNDDTGGSVNNGGVIPYAIGRATIGNIGQSAATNDLGVATTLMTYPVSRLGASVIVWAQGNGRVVAGGPKTVADVELTAYPAAGPANLVAVPEVISANTPAQVTVCLSDANDVPVRGASIGFAFQALGGGTGTANGAASGTVGPTQANGCVAVAVSTLGIDAGSGQPALVFFAFGAQAVVEIEGGNEPEPPSPAVNLVINIEGTGTGNVAISSSSTGFSPSRPGGNASCLYDDAPCTIGMTQGATAGLTAQPTGGSVFVAWSGDCTGTNVATSVVMSSPRTCTATFNAP